MNKAFQKSIPLFHMKKKEDDEEEEESHTYEQGRANVARYHSSPHSFVQSSDELSQVEAKRMKTRFKEG